MRNKLYKLIMRKSGWNSGAYGRIQKVCLEASGWVWEEFEEGQKINFLLKCRVLVNSGRHFWGQIALVSPTSNSNSAVSSPCPGDLRPS